MRTGAIFARGSCRALKWMALFGVLFALGAGSAAAQITITGPTDNEVDEGATAVYTVNVKGYLAAAADVDNPQAGGTITVELGTLTPDTTDAALTGEAGDVHQNEGTTVTFTVPANTSTTTTTRFNQNMTLRVGTNPDPDAENEAFTLGFTASGAANLTTTADGGTAIALPTAGEAGHPNALVIDDAQEQEYELKLAPASQEPTEGTSVTISLEADPPHVRRLRVVDAEPRQADAGLELLHSRRPKQRYVQPGHHRRYGRHRWCNDYRHEPRIQRQEPGPR